MTIFPRQRDVAAFYNGASVVVTLTNPLLAIETFGLTTLEAMTAGLPVIVPTKGGIAELVDEGRTGYRIDVQQIDRIEVCIREMLSDKEAYLRLAGNAQRKAERFLNYKLELF